MPIILTAFTFFALILSVSACCTTWRSGDQPVNIANQEVLIVWDAEDKMEHLVRRANFESDAAPKDFGFLVPTPTQPKLSEASDSLFHRVGEIIKPKVKVEQNSKLSFMPLLFYPFTMAGGISDSKEASAVAAGVKILERVIVGGFEVAVIRASDTEALIKWLEENDYNARPELREWVTSYVEKEWIITAFKYASGPGQSPGVLNRASVCLSFETDTPFFPYRVPSDIRVKPEDGSLLRLYFVGRERVAGEFRDNADHPWDAVTRFSNQSEGLAEVLRQVTGINGGNSEAFWLTAFEDHTWPGGAEDLFFQPSSDSDPVTPPPIVRAQIRKIHMPLDLILLAIAMGVYLYRKRLVRIPRPR